MLLLDASPASECAAMITAAAILFMPNDTACGRLEF